MLARALVDRFRQRRAPAAALPFLWSKGIARHCDVAGPDAYWRAATEESQTETFFSRHYADPHGLVWVRLGSLARAGAACDLDHFVRAALPTARRPFALITTDGDASVPSDLREETVRSLLDCPWLVSWHTQNLDRGTHPKLAPFPIGLDLHTRPRWCSARRLAAGLGRLRDRRSAPSGALRVFCDLGVSLASPERRHAVRALRGCRHVDFQLERVPQRAIWRRYASYPFALSTAGNGLDCHRTWELLYLGTIVITRTSALDPLFEGLPVAIVEDWREARDPARLADWHRRLGPLTERTRLWARLHPRHYLDPIRAAVGAAEGA
jgi:hypothetical protein